MIKRFLRWLFGIDEKALIFDINEFNFKVEEAKADAMKKIDDVNISGIIKSQIIAIIDEILQSKDEVSFEYYRHHMPSYWHMDDYRQKSNLVVSVRAVKLFLEQMINKEAETATESLKEWFESKTNASEFSDKLISAINKKQLHKGEEIK